MHAVQGNLFAVADPVDPAFQCPCCGWIVFSGEPGSYNICPICTWEDDLSQLRFPTMGGANIPLVDAQAEFAERVAWGTLDPRARGYRREPGWRLLDLLRDTIEEPTGGRDYGKTYATDRTTYYYWRGGAWPLIAADRACICKPGTMREVRRIDDWERLRLAIREELQAQHAIESRPVDDHLLDVLAHAVATRIDSGFAFRWAPRWVKPGEPHRWTEEGEHLVECLACGVTTAHPSEFEANEWYSEHRREHA